MPTFDTPQPITVTLDLSVANVTFVASARTDTVVELRPTNENEPSDVKAAKQVRVEYSGGTLLIKGKNPRPFDFSAKSWSVTVTIELPEGSDVQADVSMGDFQSSGRLGDCRFKTSAGQVRLGLTGPLLLRTGAGHVAIAGVEGDAEVTTGTGRIQIGDIAGSATIKNSNGDTEIGAIGGDARVRSANGCIVMDRVGGGVDAKTANGAIRVAAVTRGSVVLSTAMGDLDVGIGSGTSAWLDVKTSFGHVRNALEEMATPPEQTGESVEVRAHTAFGDITIHRA